MEDGFEFLQSRPLIGFQMDGAHLNNVLQLIIRQQQQLMSGQDQLAHRIDEIEEAVRDTQDHQKELERAVDELGGSDKLTQVRARLTDLENAMDGVMGELETSKKALLAASQDADAAGQLADQAYRGLAPLQETLRRLGQDVDGLSKQSAQERKDLTRALDALDRGTAEQERRVAEALREVQQNAERLSRESGTGKLRQMLEELSDRVDENFKSVEESAQAVDAELSRHTMELNGLHGELATLEEATRSRIAAVSSDADEKYRLLLSSFREYERNSSELEEHLVLAGQALSRRQGSSRRSPARNGSGGAR